MKITKIQILFCIFIMLSTMVSLAETEHIAYEGFSEIPQGWTVSTSAAATNAEVTASNCALSLKYNTVTSAAGRAELTTNTIDFSDNLFYLKTSFDFNGYASNSLRALVMLDDNALNQQTLFKVTEKSLTFFDIAGTATAVEENTSISLEFAINFTNKANVYANVLLNGSLVYEGAISFNQNYNFSKMSLKFRNTSLGGAILSSEMNVYSFMLYSKDIMTYNYNISDNTTVNRSDFNGFILSYNGVPYPDMLKKENFTLLEEGAPIDFDIQTDNSEIKIIPSEWKTFKQYEVQISLIKDIFKTIFLENQTVSFMLVEEGVTPPSAAFTDGQRTVFTEGEEVLITVNASDFDSGSFFVNDIEVMTFTQSPATLVMDTRAGIYSVKAVVLQGEYRAQSNILTVNILENPAPLISFKNYSGTVTAGYGELFEIEIEALDSDGIEKVLVYLNGIPTEELKSSPYIANISGLGIGSNTLKATAVDFYGKTSDAELLIKISASIESLVLEDCDFEENPTGNILKSGIVMNSQRGYVKVDTVDEQKGRSLLVGIETANESQPLTSLPFAYIPTGDGTTRLILECDVYVDQKETSGDKKITLKKNGSTDMSAVTFTEKMTFGNVSLDYEVCTWYSLKFDIDVPNAALSAYRDGIKVLDNYKFASGLDCVDFIRIYGPRYDTVPSYTAVDNIVLKAFYNIPEIINIGDNGIVQPDAESFSVSLNAALYGASLTTSTVIMLDDTNNPVTLNSVAWNADSNSIIITPKSRLLSNSIYTIKISEDARVSQSVATGYVITGHFKTDAEGLEVTDVTFRKSGSYIFSDINIYNVSEEEKKLYCIMTIWNGSTYISRAIKSAVSLPNSMQTVTLNDILPTGARMEVYVYNSLTAPKMLAKKIYYYN